MMKARALRQIEPAVIVAMIPVRMMQAAIDEVIDVIAVRDRFVTAAGAVDVDVRGIVPAARRGVAVGIGRAHGDDVLIDVIAMRMMQVPIVEVVDVPVVFHRGVAAAWAVGVVVMGMGFAVAHKEWGLRLPECRPCAAARQARNSTAARASMFHFTKSQFAPVSRQ
jgi:hypothetical protein